MLIAYCQTTSSNPPDPGGPRIHRSRQYAATSASIPAWSRPGLISPSLRMRLNSAFPRRRQPTVNASQKANVQPVIRLSGSSRFSATEKSPRPSPLACQATSNENNMERTVYRQYGASCTGSSENVNFLVRHKNRATGTRPSRNGNKSTTFLRYGRIFRQQPFPPQTGQPPRSTSSQSISPARNALWYSQMDANLLRYACWMVDSSQQKRECRAGQARASLSLVSATGQKSDVKIPHRSSDR